VGTSSPSNTNPVNSMQPCQLWGMIRQTVRVSVARNIEMLVVHREKKITANMCKTWRKKNFRGYTGKNLLLGARGVISLLLTPIYLVTNTVSYVSALQKLKGAVE
jgi:hypothetical protein